MPVSQSVHVLSSISVFHVRLQELSTVCLSLGVSVCLSICLSACICVQATGQELSTVPTTVCQCLYVSVCLSVDLSLDVSLGVCVCLCVCLSVCLSVRSGMMLRTGSRGSTRTRWNCQSSSECFTCSTATASASWITCRTPWRDDVEFLLLPDDEHLA